MNSVIAKLRLDSTHDVTFYKMEGCGNNFVVLYDNGASNITWQLKSKALLDRNFGIGGDGLMIIKDSPTHDFTIEMYNPDGSVMGMCGNGIRCVTRYVVMHGMQKQPTDKIRFDVAGRDIECEYHEDGKIVTVKMGTPTFDPKALPLNSTHQMILRPLEIDDSQYEVSCVALGNPHCVIFVADVDHVPLNHVGPLIEKHDLFPMRTNVEFVEVISRNQIKVRVWERGAGATLACGTGACASLVVASKVGRCANKGTVALPGGQVEINWDQVDNVVYLKGPAHEIFKGKFNPHQF